MGAEAKLALAILFGAFGIAAPVDQIVGGLFLAIGAAYLVMYFTDPKERRTYALTLLSALTCALIAGAARGALAPTWSIHLCMAAAGGLSTFLIESVMGFGGSLKEQAATLPKRLFDRIFGKGKGL